MEGRLDSWNNRFLTHKHERWFAHLAELNDLTNAWITELRMERPPTALARGLGREVTENFWMLDSLSDKNLSSFLDDTSPDDLLGRLEHTVWAVQGWTLMKVLEKTSATEKPILKSILEQISWKMGKQSAERRWPPTLCIDRQNLRLLVQALFDSAVSGYPYSCADRSFLVKRAIPREVDLELLNCPHHIRYSELKPVADDLCKLYMHWIRGFAYGLNHQLLVEGETQHGRCNLRWHFATNLSLKGTQI